MHKGTLKQLQALLIQALLTDLDTPDKCTPGLYTVVRGILNDHKESLLGIPGDSIFSIEEAMRKSLPFKGKSFDVEATFEAVDTKEVYNEDE